MTVSKEKIEEFRHELLSEFLSRSNQHNLRVSSPTPDRILAAGRWTTGRLVYACIPLHEPHLYKNEIDTPFIIITTEGGGVLKADLISQLVQYALNSSVRDINELVEVTFTPEEVSLTNNHLHDLQFFTHMSAKKE